MYIRAVGWKVEVVFLLCLYIFEFQIHLDVSYVAPFCLDMVDSSAWKAYSKIDAELEAVTLPSQSLPSRH